jgi:hypothetical protein
MMIKKHSLNKKNPKSIAQKLLSFLEKVNSTPSLLY